MWPSWENSLGVRKKAAPPGALLKLSALIQGRAEEARDSLAHSRTSELEGALGKS